MAMQNLSLASIISESKAGENDAVRAFAPVGASADLVDIPDPPAQKPKPVESNQGIQAVKGIDTTIKASEEEATKKSKAKVDDSLGLNNTDYLQTFLKLFGVA